MKERGFTHHPRRRRNAAGDTHACLVQLIIRCFEDVCGRLFAFG
jgi:hypothetical protein